MNKDRFSTIVAVATIITIILLAVTAGAVMGYAQKNMDQEDEIEHLNTLLYETRIDNSVIRSENTMMREYIKNNHVLLELLIGGNQDGE